MSRPLRAPRVALLAAPLVLVALITCPRPAHPAVVFGVEFSLGYGTYAMGAVNDTLHSFNDFLGTEFPDIRNGMAGLLALRVWPNDRLLLRLALEPMDAESGFSFVDSTGYGGTLLYDTGPVATTLTATWFFNPPQTWRFGVGGGVGWYSIEGEIKGPGGSLDLTGDGFGVHVQGEVQYTMKVRWAVGAQVGYRHAVVGDTKLQDVSANPKLATDFSGMIVRVGIAHDWWPRH